MRRRLGDALAARFGDAGRARRLLAAMRAPPGAPLSAPALLASAAFVRRRAALGLAHAARRLRDLASLRG
jgi:hypothetical protein